MLYYSKENLGMQFERLASVVHVSKDAIKHHTLPTALHQAGEHMQFRSKLNHYYLGQELRVFKSENKKGIILDIQFQFLHSQNKHFSKKIQKIAGVLL